MEMLVAMAFLLMSGLLYYCGCAMLDKTAKDVRDLYKQINDDEKARKEEQFRDRLTRPSGLLLDQLVAKQHDHRFDEIQLLLESVDGKLAQLLEDKMESDDFWDAYDEWLDENDGVGCVGCSANKCSPESCKPSCCPSAVADMRAWTVALSDNAACGYVGAVAESVTDPATFLTVDVQPFTVEEATIHPQGNTIPSDGTLRQDTEWEAYANQDLLACRKKMHEEKPLLKPYSNALWDKYLQTVQEYDKGRWAAWYDEQGKHDVSEWHNEQGKDDTKETTKPTSPPSSSEAK